ncbi:MAG: HNH endonuclease [Planctomycetes bacterium]|nr:HNH endonuclease [Planctomycetota bacterium]MBM4083758.1 HNH endonuclease [Planctomycetota bacterium]
MAQAEAYRELVTARAGGVCEYCRLVQAGSGVTFHLDHVIPPDRGGETALGNLALCCPSCNLAKANKTSAPDREGRKQPLYNPRLFDPSSLGWHLHFELDRETGIVRPLTPTGEATVDALRMNESRRVFARKLQIKAGLLG